MVDEQSSAQGDKQAGKRALAWLAWSCWMLTVGFIAVSLFLGHLNSPPTFLSDAFNSLVLAAFATIGALIASRRHANVIGWILCAGTMLWAVAGFAGDYAVYGSVTAPGSFPAALWLGLLGEWAQTIGFSLVFFFVLLLFPNGHLPSPRWRKVAWFIVAGDILSSVQFLFSTGFSGDSRLSSFTSPVGIIVPDFVSGAVGGSWLLCWVTAVVACVAAIMVRFRRAQGEERQQLKWLTYASFLSGVVLVTELGLVLLNVNQTHETGSLIFNLLLAPVPIAVGVAVLRYRLYDIDLIINRTLVYGTLTSILVLLYLCSVVLLEGLVQGLTGQGHNDLVIVVSTLVIAGLFNPLRHRIQSTIDRRFYRRKYDAAKTLAAFSATLRDEVDLNSLTGRLVEVVDETMQPAHVSLWLRIPESRVQR